MEQQPSLDLDLSDKNTFLMIIGTLVTNKNESVSLKTSAKTTLLTQSQASVVKALYKAGIGGSLASIPVSLHTEAQKMRETGLLEAFTLNGNTHFFKSLEPLSLRTWEEMEIALIPNSSLVEVKNPRGVGTLKFQSHLIHYIFFLAPRDDLSLTAYQIAEFIVARDTGETLENTQNDEIKLKAYFGKVRNLSDEIKRTVLIAVQAGIISLDRPYIKKKFLFFK